MKINLFLFTVLSFGILTQLGLASTQDLTYDSDTNQVNITYDSLNRILTENTSTVNISYRYDDQYQGTLTNVSFLNSTYRYEYDDKLRLTKETKTIDGVAFERKIYYDSMDRVVKQTFLPGTDVNYTYNSQGKSNKIAGFISSMFHNAFDNPLNRTYNSTRVSEFSYDAKGRLTQIKTGAIQNLNYSYDSVGNIISINDSANNRLYTMTYDFLDRLANTSVGSISYVYSYNELGNILKIVRDNNNTTKFVYGSNPVHAPSKIITNEAGIDIQKPSSLYSDNKTRVIQFYLANDKNTTITNANWSVDFIDGNKINSTVAFNVSSNESILTVAGFNYTNAGKYRINITGNSANNATDFENVTVKFGVEISSLSVKSMDTSNVTFELIIRNNMNVTSQSITWACDNGNSSSASFTLSGNQQKIENFSTNYSTPGVKILTCNTTSVDGNDSRVIEFEIKGIKIEDYNSTALVENQRMINFTIKNYWRAVPVTWYITSDGQTFTNTTSVLSTNGTALVSQTINYTTDNNKTVLVNISSGDIIDRYNESFILKALRIEDFDSINLTSTNRLLQFMVKNNWYLNQSVNWNITDPSITSSSTDNLTSGESLIVLVENNYTTQGTKKPTVNAYNNTFTDSFIDRFIVKMIEVLRHLVLYESQSSTITETDVMNNLNRDNISWTIDTGEQNITSSQVTTLNNSESVFIIIESNYTSSNVYVNKPTVNSSSYNDSSTSVAVN